MLEGSNKQNQPMPSRALRIQREASPTHYPCMSMAGKEYHGRDTAYRSDARARSQTMGKINRDLSAGGLLIHVSTSGSKDHVYCYTIALCCSACLTDNIQSCTLRQGVVDGANTPEEVARVDVMLRDWFHTSAVSSAFRSRAKPGTRLRFNLISR